MHIVTGILIANLLKARRTRTAAKKTRGGSDSPLLAMPGVISLAHALPGRARFRIAALTGRPEAAAQVEARLREIPGITHAAISPISGSVLMQYDPDRLKPELLAAALVRMLGLERAFSGHVEASLAREIRDWGRALNVAVYQKTGGVLDLRTALLLALALAGMKKVFAQRALAMPAGFTLLWWAGSGLLRGGGDSE